MKRGTSEEADGAAAPDGWVVRMSASKKKPYYLHVATNKTQWHHPNEDKAAKKKARGDGSAVDHALNMAVRRAFRVGGTNVSTKTAPLLLFQPWPHQVRAVAKVVAAIAEDTASSTSDAFTDFLIQHSTGSGKSYTIACLAHQLLYAKDKAGGGFHTVIILVDRIKLDQQLGDTVESFLHRNGVESVFRAETIEHLSTVVGMANVDQKVLVTTTHKLSLLVQDKVLLARLLANSSKMSGAATSLVHVAIIADEVHRSHTASTRDAVSTILDALRHKTYYIGFSATPSHHTLRLFGRPDRTATLRPFDCHSIAQAVEAGQIVNVLEHFTSLSCTYTIDKPTDCQDHEVDSWLAMELASSCDAMLQSKAHSMMHHFVYTCKAKHVFAKCLVVARNRKHVVAYHRLLSGYMKSQYVHLASLGVGVCTHFPGRNLPGRVFCTFSPYDNVHENQFNTCTLSQADVIVVCDKLDTGYNEPALVAMYIDRPLVAHGRIVQLLSRLNRCRDGKSGVFVLDYANHPAQIRRAFDEFAHEAVAPSNQKPDMAKVELDFQTACLVLWTTLPGIVLDAHQHKRRQPTDTLPVDDLVHRLSRCSKDTYMQIKHALGMLVEAAELLDRDAPYLPRQWVMELYRRLVDQVCAVKSHGEDTCDKTCDCHAVRRHLRITNMKWQWATRWSHTTASTTFCSL
ncbi:hypothetical protein, variant 1 [Aphanomyces invadans]|uniref:WW domain-containing protein n=1 Tax=Aphanomyces invadans TaxID=157072 RepID=A0A024UH66_9STRA|nr:hypothetical protein, variant 1 [Aphanomyces invadans]ETW05535.1 hypothetical protein, variant 1 [Aphanomyces invadans]|eukprot:XP_008865312.1 hypothetical protein, variant 1 [Aphanomyces invadans]